MKFNHLPNGGLTGSESLSCSSDKSYFKMPLDVWPLIKELSDSELGRLFNAVAKYAFEGKDLPPDDPLYFHLGFIKINKAFKVLNVPANARMSKTDPVKWKSISAKVFKRDNYTCLYCGAKGSKIECDHIIPFSRNGAETEDNLATSCQKCNRQKKDKTAHEFISWRQSV